MEKCKKFILVGLLLLGLLSSCHISKTVVYVPDKIANMTVTKDSSLISDDRVEVLKSIMKTKEFKNYAKALRKRDEKMEPYVAKLDEKELEALKKNSKNVGYVSAFVAEIESHINVEAENMDAKKALNNLEDVMESKNLSVLEKALLLINARKWK